MHIILVGGVGRIIDHIPEKGVNRITNYKLFLRLSIEHIIIIL